MSRLTRGEPGRSADDYIILVFYDGEKTEDQYFRGWQQILPRGRLTFVPYFVKSGGNPKFAVLETIKRIKSLEFGMCFCVCDVDGCPEDVIREARQLAADHDIILCLSQRCFEVWIILHFEYSSKEISDESEAVARVSKHLPKYSSRDKSIDFLELFDRRETAVANALKLEAEALSDHFTVVHHLVEKLNRNLPTE